MNILMLTRKTPKDGNAIYNDYARGVANNYPDALIVDYFDLYFSYGKKGFENYIHTLIIEKNIHIVLTLFVSGDLTLDIQFLKRLSERCRMGMFFFDSELFFEPVDRYYAQCADLVVLPNSSYFTYPYSLLGIPSLSVGSLFERTKYVNKKVPKDIDISFVGDITKGRRKEYLAALASHGYTVALYGAGTQNGRISFEEMIDVFNRTKINLNFSDSSHQRTFDYQSNTDYSMAPNIAMYHKQLKGRPTEIALCGGFTLTQSALGLDEFFTSEEIATFETEEELQNAISYYLNHPQQREAMEEKAYANAAERFDATRAMRIILPQLLQQEKKEKTVHLDQLFIRHFMTYHSLYVFNFFFKFKWNLMLEELRLITLSDLRLKSVWSHLRQQFKFQIIYTLKRWYAQ